MKRIVQLKDQAKSCVKRGVSVVSLFMKKCYAKLMVNENAVSAAAVANQDHARCAYCGRSGCVIHKIYHSVGRRSKVGFLGEARDCVIHDQHREYVAFVRHCGYDVELCGFAVNTCEKCLDKYQLGLVFRALLIMVLIAFSGACVFLVLIAFSVACAYVVRIGAFVLIGVCCAVGICFLINHISRYIRWWRGVAVSHSRIRGLLAEGFRIGKGADYYFNNECGSRWPCSEVDDGFKVDDFKCDYYSLVERVWPRLMREGLDTKDWSHDYLIKYPRSYQGDSFDQVDHVEYEWLGVLQ